MAITNFIPEVWAAELLTSLKKTLVFGDVANHDYEGDISEAGDTVHIVNVNRPTIGDYVKNVTVISPETLTDAERVLVIDQCKYFAFEIDDVDKRQAKGGLMTEAANEAAYGLADVVDTFVAGLVSGVQAANQISTTAITTGALAATGLVNLKVKLDEANVPQVGRFAIIPPWYHGLLLQSDTFVQVDHAGTSEALRNGVVGRAYGFDIRLSNNVTNVTGDDYRVVAGHRSALTFASQINKVEAYRPESSFSDALKGLSLYGAKLVRPDAAATLVASIT
jgi:N4-gp56 family major capsid protein